MPHISQAESIEILESYRHRVGPLPDSIKAKPMPETSKDGHTPIYRNEAILESGSDLMGIIHPRLSDLDTFFRHAVNIYGDDDCLGKRVFHNGHFDNFYTFLSYKEVLRRRDLLASGLVYCVLNNKDYKGGEEFIVSIYSENRVEWVMTDLACSSVSLPSTVLYDTLGEDSTKYILQLTESPVCCVSGQKIKRLLNLKSQGHLPDLHVVVTFDPYSSVVFKKAESLGIQLIGFDELLELGAQHKLKNYNPPTSETVHTICFTSGTTGPPKGAVLKHKNTIGFVTFCQCARSRQSSKFNPLSRDFAYNKDDYGDQVRHLCSLPLAHIYERGTTSFMVLNGNSIGFPSDKMSSLYEDWRCLRPHFVGIVPRLWNKLATDAMALLEGYDYKRADIPREEKLLIRNKLRRFYGLDRLKDAVSGSAPLAEETLNFLSDWFCIGFNQGYGTTETYSGISSGDPFNDNFVPGAVGAVGVSCEVRLRDTPHLNYFATDKPFPRGELLVRGSQIFSEYYKRPELNAEVFDEDGFYSTGDVAALDHNGNIYIIDRVKNFFKLSQGEYIAPEKIENIYLAYCPLVHQIFLFGDSFQDYLVAVISLDEDLMKVPTEDLQKREVRQHVLRQLNEQISGTGLQKFEILQNIYLTTGDVLNDVLTPTLKIQRDKASKKFGSILRGLYEEGRLLGQ